MTDREAVLQDLITNDPYFAAVYRVEKLDLSASTKGGLLMALGVLQFMHERFADATVSDVTYDMVIEVFAPPVSAAEATRQR